jgi:hypothetical protein
MKTEPSTNEQLLNQPLTTEHMQAMLLTLAAELAGKCLDGIPEAHPHVIAGAGIELVITLRPSPAWSLRLIDSDQSRRLLASRDYSAESTKH